MGWTVESYRAHAPDFLRAPRRRKEEPPYTQFVRSVDRLFYAAAIGLAACVAVLLVT